MALAQKASGKNLTARAYQRILESKCCCFELLGSILTFRRYTYEVCLFDEARQIPKSGGSGFSLGYVV